MSERSRTEMPTPLWKARARTGGVALGGLTVVALLAWLVVHLLQGGGPPVTPDARTSFSVSYAGAASRLQGRTAQDTDEQLRDWARFGLAARLGMGTAAFRDAAYDTLPVRDPGFDDLARQPAGPGRSLADGRGTLHVLAPVGDRHEARTIGLQIDQYRTDSGADPRRVQVHHYAVQRHSETITITSGAPAPTRDVRARYGYVLKRIDTAAGLNDFLASAGRLSTVQTRGRQIWAGGWDWGASPVSAEDVSVLQDGYVRKPGRTLPGFSLDPEQARTAQDVRAVAPGLRPALANGIVAGKVPAGLPATIQKALFTGTAPPSDSGLPTDRTRLWTLYNLIQGGPAFAQERYDGGLAGTKVGMTLAYTDYVAKHWVAGAGSGVPSKAVGGFVSDPDADIPWSECGAAPAAESGRLWFGENTSGFSYGGDRVNIGAQATRLFAKANDGGTEVEPSYSMGRGLRWWDQHYQDVADYEPQYARLDEIMRWSGVLDWLTSRPGAPRLPQLGPDRITRDLRFKDWYARGTHLRERAPIAFVRPPSARQEALLNAPSKTFKQCGFVQISGGVSLAGRLTFQHGDEGTPNLPPNTRRAGQYDPASRFDGSTGRVTEIWKDATGKVADALRRTFTRGSDGTAEVTTDGEPRKVEPFGRLKLQSSKTEREVRTRISAGGRTVRQSVDLDGEPYGELTATARTANVINIQWRRGLLDRVRSAAQTVQNRRAAAKAAVPGTGDVLYGYRDGDGRTRYKVGGTDADWLAIGPADDARMTLRLGSPNPRTGTPEFLPAAVAPMRGPGAPRGPPHDGWLATTPNTPGEPVTLGPVDGPRDGATSIRVASTDGTASQIRQDGSRLFVRSDDPVVGLNSSESGAALIRDFSRVRAAMREAAQARDGLFRAVGLGPDGSDGTVLAGAHEAVVVATDYQWRDKVQAALGVDASASGPHFRFTPGTEPVHVGKNTVKPQPGGEVRQTSLSAVLGQNPGDVYATPRLNAQVFGGAAIPRAPPPRDVRVTVRPLQVQPGTTGESVLARPDVYRPGGRELRRIAPEGGGPGGLGGPGGRAGPRLGTTTTVVLVCAQQDDDPYCDDDDD